MTEHLDPTLEISLETVKSRAVKGVLTLTGRTFMLQVMAFISTFLLTVLLDPKDYGVFFGVSAVINFFAYFSDIGLAAALIQKKEKPTDKDLKTTFTLQQLLVFLVIVIVIVGTPFVKNWYNLSQEAIYLFWSLGISLLLSSLKTIPSILLERKLEFGKLVIPQIVETLLFNLVAVYLAWRGFGITSFTIAVLVRSVSGLVIMYILQPWVPGVSFSKKSLQGLLKFGLPYQTNTFLAVLKDDGMTAFLAGIIGPAGIGLLGWAQKWAFAPLRFFMDQVIKVTFPAYSRMQDNKDELSKAINKSIFFISALVFPSLVGLVIVAPVLTEVIPKYEKWQPALFALSLFSINAAWAAITTPLTNVLNATGKIKTTFKLMIMWTGLTWAVVPALAYLYGTNGAAGGSAIVGTSSIVAILVVNKFVKLDFLRSVIKPLLASFVMGVVLYLFRDVLPNTTTSIFILIASGLIVYLSLIILLAGTVVVSDTKKVLSSLKRQ